VEGGAQVIADPVAYDGSEQNLVDAILSEKDFNGATWSKPELSDLKTRIKQHYIQVQKYRCCYCQQTLYSNHGRVWDIEHVIARDTRCDFMFIPRNLAISCVECNGAKKAELVADPARKSFPDRGDLYWIVHPHFHNWDEHIEIEGEGTYHALSKEGKFTIYHCDLFRFRERVMRTKQPIRDRRFEKDIGELRMAKSSVEARPIIASIMARLEIEDER
jgi:hypothetical protein